MATSSTVLVVPCHNERDRLPLAAFTSLAEARQASLVFVDDGSTDGTAELIEGFRRGREAHVTLVRLPVNVGKGEAVRAGLQTALAQVPDFIGYWDADLATPLDALGDLMAVMLAHPAVDLVLGSRVQLMGRAIERSPVRHYAGRVFATVASMVLRLPVYDTQCGAKLLRVGDWLRAAVVAPFASRWVFDVELIARYVQHRGSPEAAATGIHEFPLREWRDVPGSKVRPWDLVVAIADAIRVRGRYPALAIRRPR